MKSSQIILAVGTKLQAVLTRMALDIKERHAVVQGIPLVQASDKYFWFGRPRLVLHLIHFALFQVCISNLQNFKEVLLVNQSFGLNFASTIVSIRQITNMVHGVVCFSYLYIPLAKLFFCTYQTLQNAFQITYFLWIWVITLLPVSRSNSDIARYSFSFYLMSIKL